MTYKEHRKSRDEWSSADSVSRKGKQSFLPLTLRVDLV